MQNAVAIAFGMALMTLSALPSTAGASSAPLTVERAFASPGLSGPAARSAALSPDGALLTWLRPAADNQFRMDLWMAQAAGGEARILVAGAAVEPEGQVLSETEKSRRERQRVAAFSGVTSYSWNETSQALLIPAGGALFLADARTGAVSRLPTGPDIVDARLSPLGKAVAYVRAQNLYILDLKPGSGERAITSTGKGSVTFGLAEFVAQEEMDRFEGYWWSPGDTAIAYAKVDESPVALVDRLEIGPQGSTSTPQRYPRAGTANAVVTLYVQSLAGKRQPVKVDLGADTDIYVARVAWSADGQDLYVQRQSRDQTRLDLLRVDPATGASRVIVGESQTPWISLNDDFRPLDDGTFIWGSARTGADQLYLYDRGGVLIRPITTGPAPHAGGSGLRSRGLVGVDEAAGLVYFMASEETPIERQLYVASYRASGEARAVTRGHGWWTATMPKAATRFIGYYSDPATPPQSALYSPDGARLQWIEENRLTPDHPFFPYADRYPAPEFGVLKAADGQDLHTVLLRPAGFDPAQRYPAIVEVYGGPGVQTVTRAWRSPAEKLYLEAGYVVFQLDNRGSANRDMAFQGAIAGRLGSVELDDQVVGLNWLRAQPFVDPARIGVSGWSYGGYMSLMLLTDPRTHLKAGAAGAPPTDWREYDTHYTERYLGMPQQHAAAYDRAAVIPRLGALQGRLLLLQGMADDNVQITNSFAVMADLQARSVPFDLMLFPGQRHGIQGEAKQVQLWRTFLQFFDRELAARHGRQS